MPFCFFSFDRSLILLQKYDKILRLQNKKKGKMYCKKQKVGKSQNHRRDTQEGWQHPVEWHQCFCRKALRKLEPGGRR